MFLILPSVNCSCPQSPSKREESRSVACQLLTPKPVGACCKLLHVKGTAQSLEAEGTAVEGFCSQLSPKELAELQGER